MDAISLGASVIAFLQATQVIVQAASDFKNAPEERKLLCDEASYLGILLSIWIRRLEEAKANPDDLWYQNILRLAGSAPGDFTKDGEFITAQDREREANRASRRSLSPYGIHFRSRSSSRSRQNKDSKEQELAPKPPAQSNIFTRLASLREELKVKMDEPIGLKKYTYRVTWTVSKSGYLEMRDNMRSLKGDLDSIVLQSNFDAVLSIRQEQVRIRAQEEREEKLNEMKEIMAWVSPMEFYETERRIYDDSFPAGKWMIDHPVFKGWELGQPSELYCYGAPGSGKTVLSSIVLNYLRDKYDKDGDTRPNNKRTAVLSLFIKYKSKDQDVLNLYASLVKQLMAFQGESFEIEGIRNLHHKARGVARPSERDLEPILQRAISNLKRVLIVVDALDEWPDTSTASLIKHLRALPFSKVSLMFTSRPVGDDIYTITCDGVGCQTVDENLFWLYNMPDRQQLYICDDCKEKKRGPSGVEPDRSVEVQIKTPSGEIEEFVRWVMGKELGYILARPNENIKYGGIGSTRLGRALKRDTSLQKEIPSLVSSKAKNRFLLAKLYSDKLLKQPSVEAVRQTLKSLPEELDKVYDEIIQHRIIENDNKDDARLGMQVLSWIAFQRRPMTIMELQQAIAVKDGDKDLREGYEIDEQTILEVTAGLLSIDLDKTISPHHYTAQEYFLESRKRWFPDAELHIAMAILTYLGYDEFSKPSQKDHDGADLKKRLQKYAFLAYASQHWGDHVRELKLDEEKLFTIQGSALSLLMDKDRLASTIQVDSASWAIETGVNGMQMAGRFGLEELIPLLQKSLAVDDSDPRLQETPLMYACRWGHEATVTRLLQAGANVNSRSVRGTTALYEAIERDHPSIVGILQKANADLEQTYPSDRNRAALVLAASYNAVYALRYLLERQDIDVNQQDAKGYTALMLAASKGNTAMINILINHPKIKVDLYDDRRRTALFFAAGQGGRGNVRALLNKGADPTIKSDIRGSNAAITAVQFSNLAAIEELLEKHPTLIASIDDAGRGLLHYAASENATDIIDLLLTKGLGVNDPCQKHGETPLHEACRNGQVEAAEFLLEKKADPSIKDLHQRTPYLIAWQHGQTAIIRLLEKKNLLKEDLPDPSSLPAWAILTQKRRDLLDARLSQDPLPSLDEKDPDNGYTALHIAVLSHQTPELLLLLSHSPSLSSSSSSPPIINTPDSYLRTPLHLAAETGNLPATKALLAHGAALEARNTWASAPLQVAQGGEHWAVAIALVEAGAHIDLQSHPVQSLLFAAVAAGKPIAVRKLLEQGADPNVMSFGRQRAVDVAQFASYGEDVRREVLRALRGEGGV